MATKLGDAYVSVVPDFSGFQEKVAAKLNESLGPTMDRAGKNASKRLSKSLASDSSLRSSLQPLLKRFQKDGDNLGEQLAARIGKGAKRAEGDMFGLSGAIKEMEKRSSSASSWAKVLANDTFGIARAAVDAGQGYKLLRNTTSGWAKDAKAADRVGERLSKGVASLARDVFDVGRNLKASAGGFGNFEGIMARANRGFQFFRNILGSLKLPALAAGVALFAQSLSALAAGAVATASALGPLSGALIALPALALAGASAVGTLKLALSGIGDAVKAATAVQVQGGEQATQVLRQQENAAEAVADANRTLKSAERDAGYATEDLTKARKEATAQLHDLERASRESRLTEQEGTLALREARQELTKTLREPSSTGTEIESAEQAVERAKYGLESTREEAKKARKDYADANKKGVEGSTEVISAKRAQADADRSVKDAERGVAKAVRENTDAMKQQGSAATALQQKMAELTPAGRKFAKFLISLKPRYDELRETASKGLFPGAESGIKDALKNAGVVKKIVGETSSALGGLAAKAGAKLGSDAWGRDLAKIGESDTRIIERLGQAGLNLGDAFRNIMVSAEPLLDWMSEGTVKFSEWLKTASQTGRETGSLSHFFDETRGAMERVWRILKPLGEGFLNVGHFAKGLGNEILDSLGDAAEGWAKWTKTTSGQNTLKNYFKEVRPAVFEIGRLVRDATVAFVELGRQKGVSTLVRAVRTTLIPALRDGSGAITGLLSGFIQNFNKLRREGVPVFAAFLQDLAEHAAEAGKELAKALVTAFLNSDIWGKLAIGGWLFAKFGGGKAFESLGAKFGRKFSEAFLLAVLSTELAKQVKQIIEGEKLDAPKSEQFSKFIKEYFEVDQAWITKPNRVKIKTALGNILFNSETEKVVAVSNKKLQWIVGQIPEQFIVKFEQMRQLQQVMHKNLGPLPGIAGKAGTDLKASLLPKLSDLAGKGGGHLEALGGSFESLSGTVSESVETIQQNVSGMIKSFGIGHVPKFTVKYLHAHAPSNGKKYLNKLPELATGGLAATVPGNTTGDRHVLALGGRPVAKVESGEGIFVGNRKMMAAAKAANDHVPRFQNGGFVGSPQMLKRGGLVEPKLEGQAGPLKQLGQAAIKKVYEGAKGYLDKHRAPAGEGGSIADAGSLQQFNHVFPEHMLSNASGKARFSEALTAHIAAWAGLPGRLFGQIAHGESDFYPGVYGIDPGGTEGLGLWQITTSYNDDKIAKWGGRKQMFNPLKNAKAAKEVYDEAGIGAWYGTKFVTGMQDGGLLKLAAGGLLGAKPEKRDPRAKEGQPFNPSIMSGIAQSGPPIGATSGFLPKTIGRIKAKAQQVASTFTGYVWGGGHSEGTHVTANGLDCSGAVAKLVQESGWTDFPVAVSTEYASRFHPGAGDLFTIWSNPDHTFAEIEGRQWGTNTSNGLGYASHTTSGFTPSHPTLAAEPTAGGGAGGGASGRADKPVEKPLPSYAGLSTESVKFGHPKTLKATERELERLTGKDGDGGLLKRYRDAAAKADKAKKPATADALRKCAHSIDQRVVGLRRQRRNLRMVEAGKALKKRITSKLSKIEGYDQRVQGAQHLYEEASEIAEGVVGLEPESPEVPPEPELEQAPGESDKAFEKRRRDTHNAYEVQREGTEKDYAARYTAYVEGQEGPAYQGVLGRIATWRNTILEAETHGFDKDHPSIDSIERGLEHSAHNKVNKIDAINEFTKIVGERVQAYWEKVKQDVSDWRSNHSGQDLPEWLKKEQDAPPFPTGLQEQVEKRDREREELPYLRSEKTELEEAIRTAREAFFAGGKNRLVDPPTLPRLPLPGSGTFEGYLEEVQGIHPFPELHEILGVEALAPPRDPSRFRGVISTAQESIEGLGLKIRQAGSSVQKASIEKEPKDEGPDNTEKLELELELARNQLKRDAINETLGGVIDQFNATYKLPFAGTFHTGGTVDGPSSREFMAKVRGEEHILTPKQMAALSPAGESTAGGAPVIESLVIHPDGRATMRFEGREFETAVREVVRSTPRPLANNAPGRVFRP